jgi:hypothetical protein
MGSPKGADLTRRTTEPGTMPISINLSVTIFEVSTETMRTVEPSGVLSRVTKPFLPGEIGFQYRQKLFGKSWAACRLLRPADLKRFHIRVRKSRRLTCEILRWQLVILRKVPVSQPVFRRSNNRQPLGILIAQPSGDARSGYSKSLKLHEFHLFRTLQEVRRARTTLYKLSHHSPLD